VVESFRGDYEVRYFGGVITPGQLVSIGIFVAGLILLFLLRHVQKKAVSPSHAPNAISRK
jgi:hypothetical protein